MEEFIVEAFCLRTDGLYELKRWRNALSKETPYEAAFVCAKQGACFRRNRLKSTEKELSIKIMNN